MTEGGGAQDRESAEGQQASGQFGKTHFPPPYATIIPQHHQPAERPRPDTPSGNAPINSV
jgi:hypothetical protein